MATSRARDGHEALVLLAMIVLIGPFATAMIEINTHMIPIHATVVAAHAAIRRHVPYAVCTLALTSPLFTVQVAVIANALLWT